MNDAVVARCTAFDGVVCIASGEWVEVAVRVKERSDQGLRGPLLVFDDATAEPVEFDLRGTVDDVRRRIQSMLGPAEPAETPGDAAAPMPRGPGRPKLGVVAREVTLLPRHWDWLGRQPGGASVALRKLVDEARRTHAARDRVRQSQEAANRFMQALAGDLPGYEEASRALFAANRADFETHTAAWPSDVRAYAHQLAEAALAGAEER